MGSFPNKVREKVQAHGHQIRIVKFAITVLLIALFTFLAERQNPSSIPPWSATLLVSFAYYLIALIIFQYSDFKRQSGRPHRLEFLVLMLSSHIYASRLSPEAVSLVTAPLGIANVVFCWYFLADIAAECRSIPNIKKFYAGVFGEYPISTLDAANRAKPLLWFFVLIPVVSMLLLP